MNEEKLNKRRIILYLILTFAVTYVIEIFGVKPLTESTDPGAASYATSLIAACMFVPAVASLLTRVITGEKLTVKSTMLLLNLKGNLRYYAIAWFGLAGLILFGAVVYFLIFPNRFDPTFAVLSESLRVTLEAQGQDPSVVTDKMVLTVVLGQTAAGIMLSPFANLINCFGEEWGWRGYLVPKMLKQFKVVPTMLITGVIWGVWHAPITVLGHNFGTDYPGYPVVGILLMCIFCTALGIILSYVTFKTGSILPAVMGHGLMNGFAQIGKLFIKNPKNYDILLGPMPFGILGGIGLLLTAGYLLVRMKKEEDANQQKRIVEESACMKTE